MNDLISRKEAIDILYNYKRMLFDGVPDPVVYGVQGAIEVIKTIPCAVSTAEWIPCSERLPCTYTSVEVTYEHNGKRYTTVGDLEDDDEWHTELLGYGGFFGSRIIAWRPLPEPYEEREDETD